MTKTPTTITRRTAIALAGSAIAMPSVVRAQGAYPNRTITFVCAFSPGSGADTLVRYFADRVQKVAGQTIIVDNRPGAAGNVSAEFVARSRPDGYTIYPHAASSTAANMHLFRRPPIDVAKDLQMAGKINRQAFMFVVPANSPINNVKELTEHLRPLGDKASYASAATSGKVMAETYKVLANLKTEEVNYRDAGESLNDLLSGQVVFGAHDPVFCLSQASQGRLKILATAAGERLKAIPNVPTMTEQGYPMDQLAWWGVFVPSATPRPIVDTINGWFKQVLETDETREFLARFGGDVAIGTPDEAQAMLLKTIDQWKEFVQIAKLPQQ